MVGNLTSIPSVTVSSMHLDNNFDPLDTSVKMSDQAIQSQGINAKELETCLISEHKGSIIRANGNKDASSSIGYTVGKNPCNFPPNESQLSIMQDPMHANFMHVNLNLPVENIPIPSIISPTNVNPSPSLIPDPSPYVANKVLPGWIDLPNVLGNAIGGSNQEFPSNNSRLLSRVKDPRPKKLVTKSSASGSPVTRSRKSAIHLSLKFNQ